MLTINHLTFSGAGNFCLIHVSLVPVLSVVGEQVNFLAISYSVALVIYLYNMSMTLFLRGQKTKPTQHSVRGLRSLGLTPNILACRSTTVSLPPSLSLSISLSGLSLFLINIFLFKLGQAQQV